MTLFGYVNSTRSPNSYRSRLVLALIIAVFLSVSVGQVVSAATPDENGKIRREQIALASSHLASVAGGLASGFLGTISEMIAFSTDFALKNWPATLDIPDDLSVDPDAFIFARH